MNRPRHRLPLAARIAGSTIVVVVLVIGFMLSYFPRQQNVVALEALKVKTLVVSKIVSSELTSALDFDDATVIRDALQSLREDSDFVYASMFGGNGASIASVYSDTKEGRGAQELSSSPQRVAPVAEPQIAEHEHSLDIHYPVVTPSGRRGTLVARFSLARLEQEASEAMRATLSVALGVLVFGVLAALLMSRSIGTRVKRVVGLAERVARGEIAREGIADEVYDEIGDIARSFNRMNENLTALADRVGEVAAGDLSNVASVEGELAEAFNRMVVNQRELVKQISSTATMLSAAAGEFFANAKQQARGATNQSTAVEEVRRTLDTLLHSAREIGATAENVLTSAERSQENSQNVTEKIAALSNQTRSIAEILEVIKDIANKSDLLALNAGLEGTKAGEAGKGFSLVASQMQRLAENVMGAVRNIKELTTTITESTQATVLATEESTKLASDTTFSARQIGLTIRQQQSGTEQAVKAMVDVGEVAAQTASGSRDIVASATDLMKLSEQLQTLVGRFRVARSQ